MGCCEGRATIRENEYDELKTDNNDFIDSDMGVKKAKVSCNSPTAVRIHHHEEQIEKKRAIKVLELVNNSKVTTEVESLFNTPEKPHYHSVYEVASVIDTEAKSVFLYFIFDKRILDKHEKLLVNGILSVLEDFKNYFLTIPDRDKEFIKICKIVYDDKHIMKPVHYKYDPSIKDICTFQTKNEIQIDNSRKGEIDAVNAILESGVDHSKILDEAIFTFHFCGNQFDDEDIYKKEINSELRSLVMTYELILLEENKKKNEIFPKILSDVICVDVATVSF